MDENTAEPQVYISPTPWYKRKILWIFLSFLILIPLGFYIFKTYFLKTPAQTPVQQPTQIQSEPGIKESELPVAVDILQNPMVYEWRGSVEGVLTQKDDKSITLEKDGKSITISVDLNPNYTGTKFFKGKPTKDPKSNFISLDNIQLNTKLRGDFFVFPDKKNEKVGSSFMVIEQ